MRSDGTPQASPVTCGVDAAGRIVVSTYPERAKTVNRPPGRRAAVVVLSDDFGGPWVQVDGDAEVLDLPESVEPLVEYFRCISGEHPDWEEYRDGDAAAGQVPDPGHAPAVGTAIATGGFPPRLLRLAQ